MRTALALLLTLLVAAPAQAATTKVTWPEARVYGPGERIAVTVKGDRKVKVVVHRVSWRGKVMRVLARRELRRGTVTVTLPRQGRYVVRVDRRERRFQVDNAPGTTPGQPPAQCVPADAAPPTATLSADRVQRGQSLAYTITNAAATCIWLPNYRLELQGADGSWGPAPWPLIFPDMLIALAAGAEAPGTVSIPADAPLGTYRLLGYAGFTEPTFQVVE